MKNLEALVLHRSFVSGILKKCVEPQQKYKYNCLQKSWKSSLLLKIWGPPKSGALGSSRFTNDLNIEQFS